MTKKEFAERLIIEEGVCYNIVFSNGSYPNRACPLDNECTTKRQCPHKSFVYSSGSRERYSIEKDLKVEMAEKVIKLITNIELFKQLGERQ